jgi:hypothetical protein
LLAHGQVARGKVAQTVANAETGGTPRWMGRILQMTEAELETKEEKPTTPDGGQEEPGAIERLLDLGGSQGYVTYDDVMEAIPEAELNIEQLEDALAALIERRIEITDTELMEPVVVEDDIKKTDASVVASPAELDLTAIDIDDSISLYLKEIGRIRLPKNISSRPILAWW